MTQTNNERNLILDDAVAAGADIIGAGERIDQAYEGERTLYKHFLFSENELLAFLKLHEARAQSPISQNDQHEVVAYADASLVCTISTYMIKELESRNETNKFPYHLWPTKLYTSPKQIPDGWKPIETAPKGESVLVAGGDCNYPCVANWSGHHEDVWCVDGQMDSYAEIGWPTHWIPLDSLPELPTAPTNTEVGE